MEPNVAHYSVSNTALTALPLSLFSFADGHAQQDAHKGMCVHVTLVKQCCSVRLLCEQLACSMRPLFMRRIISLGRSLPGK